MIKKSLKFGKNPDEIVKDSLRWISKFYPSMSPIINTIYPKEDKKIFTMAVTPSGSKGTLLLYNPEFVISSTEYFHDNLPDVNTKDYGKTIICNVSKHEIYHIMLNHIYIIIRERTHIENVIDPTVNTNEKTAPLTSPAQTTTNNTIVTDTITTTIITSQSTTTNTTK